MNTSYMQLKSINPNLQNIFHYEFTHFIVAYCILPVSFVVLCLNSLLLWIFWKKKATNTTHLLVAATSISETLFAFIPSAFSTYMFAIKGLRIYVPYEYCNIYYIIFLILPAVCRCHSIWLTVALATQRCICVRYPFKAALLFTRRKTIYVIVGLFVLSLLTQCYDVIFVDIIKVNVAWSEHTKPRGTCAFVTSEWAANVVDTVFPLHTIGSILIVNVIPFLWLVVVGSLLLRGLRVAINWRSKFVDKSDNQNRAAIGERKLTVLTIWIIVMFLIFQIPYSIVDSFLLYCIGFGKSDGTIKYLMVARTITHSIVLLTLPSTFVIYIVCYRNYYEYIKTFFRCRE